MDAESEKKVPKLEDLVKRRCTGVHGENGWGRGGGPQDEVDRCKVSVRIDRQDLYE